MNDLITQANIEESIPPELKARYSDFQYVGQGGMGKIVSAHDTVLNKRVAIKLLPNTTLSDTAIVRFHQEAKAVSKLNHINVVQVLDFGFSEAGDPYLVMELVKGRTLESIVERDKKIEPRRAVEIAAKIAEGIQHAHANGVIHRDLKPGNVMITEENVVKILDFGLAKLLDQANVDWRLTRPGQAMGSPLFMSPEQVRGEDVDERADVFSLGLLIHKLITGVVPFEEENLMKLLLSRLEAPQPVLPEFEDDPVFSEELAHVMKLAMARNREERFATMADFHRALVELTEIAKPKQIVETGLHGLVKFSPMMIGKYLLIAALAITIPIAIYNSPEIIRTCFPQMIKEKSLNEPFRKKGVNEMPDYFIESKMDGMMWWQAREKITDKDLHQLDGKPIHQLCLQTNVNITNKGIETISKLPLTQLRLRDMRIDDGCMPYLANIPNLQWLDLRNSHVTDKGIKCFKPSNKMEVLNLDYMKGVTNEGLKHIVKCFPNLQHIDLGDTGVTAEGLPALKSLKHLVYLSVRGLGLRDEDMDVIAEIDAPKILLEGNLITDKGLAKLKKCTRLSYLNVEYCRVSNEAIRDLQKKFPGLKYRKQFPGKEEIETQEMLYQEPDPI